MKHKDHEYLVIISVDSTFCVMCIFGVRACVCGCAYGGSRLYACARARASLCTFIRVHVHVHSCSCML